MGRITSPPWLSSISDLRDYAECQGLDDRHARLLRTGGDGEDDSPEEGSLDDVLLLMFRKRGPAFAKARVDEVVAWGLKRKKRVSTNLSEVHTRELLKMRDMHYGMRYDGEYFPTYEEIKAELAKREHVPRGKEAKERRRAIAFAKRHR